MPTSRRHARYSNRCSAIKRKTVNCSMTESTIYSIGHGTKKIEDFIDELKSYSILYLLDIRSRPFSKWNPQFNQPALEVELERHGITYVFVGDTLGGLPDDRSCYDKNGKVVYD